jgi:hypothetical protein
MLPYVAVCCRMLPYAAVCSRMLTYAHVCSRMLTYAHVRSRMLTYAHVCCDVCLTYADVCCRMQVSHLTELIGIQNALTVVPYGEGAEAAMAAMDRMHERLESRGIAASMFLLGTKISVLKYRFEALVHPAHCSNRYFSSRGIASVLLGTKISNFRS